MDEGQPIFLQVAQRLEAGILDGSFPEEGPVPSINELATYYRINPATALKGVNRLVDEELLYKRRGVGMFVASGARSRLLAQRREEFAARHVRPMLAAAAELGITTDEITTLMERES